jgi:hypothetical protein
MLANEKIADMEADVGVLPSPLRLLVSKAIPECRDLIDMRIRYRHHVGNLPAEIDEFTSHYASSISWVTRRRQLFSI